MSLIRRRSPVVADGTPPRRRTRRRRPRAGVRRLVHGALLVAAGTAALSLAGPFALRPFTDVAGAAGEVSVGFVLDFGGSSANVVEGCVTVPASDNRYDALAAFTQERGLGAPSYAPSGLLCSINGTPSSGCGQLVAGGYIYWSYFTGGTGTWVYSNTGAGGTVTPGDVEGWRFQDPGSGRPNDPPPRFTADYATLCPTTSPTTTTPTSGRTPGGRDRAGGGVVRTRVARASRTGSRGSAATTSTTTTTTSTYPPSSGASATSLPDTSIPPDPEVGLATVSHHTVTGGGPDPLIIGGIVVALLAAGAWVRWRRRPRTP